MRLGKRERAELQVSIARDHMTSVHGVQPPVKYARFNYENNFLASKGQRKPDWAWDYRKHLSVKALNRARAT